MMYSWCITPFRCWCRMRTRSRSTYKCRDLHETHAPPVGREGLRKFERFVARVSGRDQEEGTCPAQINAYPLFPLPGKTCAK